MKKLIFLIPSLLLAFISLAQTPVAFYPFSGNANDVIGSNNGTVNGATLTTDRFGNANSSYSFDGLDDFIQMPSPAYTAYTIEASVRFSGTTADRNVVVFTQGNPFVSASHQIRTDASGHFVHYSFDGNGHALLSNTIALPNVDYHVAIVASNNGQMKLYINGVEEGTPINIGTLWAAGTELRIGTGTVGIIGLNNANYFNGSIDDVNVYNTALTASQVQREYSKSLGLVASYAFTGNADDASGNNLNGTINGATLTTDRFGNANSAYSFDGVDDFVNLTRTSLPAGLTYEAWIKTNSNAPHSTNYDGNPGITIVGDHDNNIFNTFGISSGKLEYNQYVTSWLHLNGNILVNDGLWHHVAATHNAGGVVSLYVDGVLDVTANLGYNANNFDRIGGSYLDAIGTGNVFNGAMDEVKIYNTGLSAAQVLNEYNTSSSNLVASYPFTGNANDAIGSNHGTVNGATLTTDRFGNANGAYSFDGVDDKITAPISTTVTDNFTLSGWVKINSIGTNQMLFYNGNSSLTGYGLYLTSNGILNVLHGALNLYPTSATLSTNQWYFLAMVRQSGITKVYVNAIEVYSSITSTPNTPNDLFYMSSNTLGTEYFNGSMDDIKIYPAPLSASQIASEYANNVNPLIAYYKFNNTPADSSGNSLHGTIIGSPTFTIDRNGNANSAMAFNGNVANRIEVDDNLLLHTLSITIGAWVKFNSLGGIKTIVDKPLGGNVSDSWHFGTENGNFSCWHFNSTNTYPYTQVTSPISTNQWYYIVNTFDDASKQHKLYIDGVLKTTNTFNSTIGYDNSKMYIGAAIENGSLNFPMDGVIDEIKIYGNAMTASQILDGYKNEVAANKPGSGNAISFDGTNDYVSVPNSASIQPGMFVTAECWAKSNTATWNNYGFLVNKQDAFMIHPREGVKTINFYIYTSNGVASTEYIPGASFDLTQWHHYAGTYNGITGQTNFYIDGILVTQVVLAGGGSVTVNNNPLSIGVDPCCPGRFFNGFMDEVCLWNTALTQVQIRDRMCHKITSSDPLYSNLIAYYNFDETTGTTAFDGSLNNNNGILTNSPTRVTSSAAIGNASAHDYINVTKTASLTHAGGETFSVTSTIGNPDALQVYRVDVAPNTTSGLTTLADSSKYFGVFQVGGTAPQYSATYNYASNTAAMAINEDNLRLYKRSDNAATSWASIATPPNKTANTITVTGQSTEYILGRIEILQQYLPGSGNAISFDGVDDAITVPYNTSLAPSAVSIETWVKINAYSSTKTGGNTQAQYLVFKPRVNAAAFEGYALLFNDNSKKIMATVTSSSGTQVTIESNTILDLNKFYHIAVTANSTEIKLYINGILQSSAVTGFALSYNTDPLQIGQSGYPFDGKLNGTMDEIKIWNTALTESQIRDRMCRKITQSDALFNNLVAYYNFDETTGTTAYDGTLNNIQGILQNGATRVTSGAPIGNTSAHNYSGATASVNLAHPTRGDDLTATLTAGAADGIQVYHVNEAPNTRNGILGLDTNKAYFGTFVVGGTSPSFNTVYNYDGILGITTEEALSLFERNDNATTGWTSAGASLNTTANTLTKNAISASQKEFIVGQNDPGIISADQSSCFSITPNPLTGTIAFNSLPSVTYQWQDSIVGGIWNNISGATTGASYAPPLLNAPKYYRRLATLSGLTIPSNTVFLDIRGGIHPSVMPLNQWNIYAFDGTSVDSIGITYKGSYSRSTLGFNTVTDFGSNSNPATATGYNGCVLNAPGNQYTLFAKRKGFPTGSYILTVPLHDDDLKVIKDGAVILTAGCCNNQGSNIITLGTLDANSTFDCRVSNTGGPGHLQVEITQQNLTGGTIGSNQTNCGDFIPNVFTNNVSAYGGSSLNINYQWQESTYNINFNDIAGATNATYQAPLLTQDNYYRRKALNVNSETAFSNTLFMDFTLPTLWYEDVDGDGFGNALVSQTTCAQPNGYVSNNTDCNDANLLEHPGQTWYLDADNDLFATATSLVQCTRPANYKAASELISASIDCNDNNNLINPNAIEICNGVDDDCDGLIDEGVSTQYFQDSDGDGFGNIAISQYACTQPIGYVLDATDCNDAVALIHAPIQYFIDADHDGFGSTNTAMVCSITAPLGYSTNNTDCNDGEASLHVPIPYYVDADQDGYGSNTSALFCSTTPPSGYAANHTDCNDADSVQHPGQVWQIDMDDDGYGTGVTVTQCLRPTHGYRFYEMTQLTNDCNDNDPLINAGMQHIEFSGSPNFTNNVIYPLQGDPSTNFQFEATYFDANNGLPSFSYPRIYLDHESNFLLGEANDRLLIMTPSDVNDNNTVDGKKYIASISGLPNGTNYQTFLIAEDNNTCIKGRGPFPNPDVLVLPDLQIFANDIYFSSTSFSINAETPPVSSPLTVNAYVNNTSDFSAQNFVVHLKNQGDLLATYPDITIPNLAPHSSTLVSWNIITPAVAGWYPMQVSVDYTNVIAEPNELDNVAVLAFTNINTPLVGSIQITTSVTPTTSLSSVGNILYLQGSAGFVGTNLPGGNPVVSGAPVNFQIAETGEVFTGTTDALGNINIPFTAPVGAGLYHISGTISSPPYTGTINSNANYFNILPICRPDLNVTLVQGAGTILQGQSITQDIIVKNVGCLPTTISSHVTINIAGATPSLLTVTVPPLAVGQTYTTSLGSLVYASEGNFSMCANVDDLFEIEEANENNNSSCRNLTVLPSLPELAITEGLSGTATICNARQLYVVIKNFGGVAAGAFTCQIRVKLGSTVVQTYNKSIVGIPPQGTFSYSEYFTTNTPGLYSYEVECDFGHVVNEVDENNNLNVYPIELTSCLPDLATQTCDVSALSANGSYTGTMNLSATIGNIGVLATSTPIHVRFQFSNNTFVDAVYTGILAPNAVAQVTASTTAFIDPTVTMKVVVDPTHLIAELNEANNESADKPTAWDFFPTAAATSCGKTFWKFSYRPLKFYSLPAFIGNAGMYDAPLVKMRYEVSGPGITGTLNLGNGLVYNTQQICTGCPNSVNLPNSFVFPQTGTYTFTLTVDPDNEYAETDELNNVLVKSVNVYNKADMQTLTSYINPSILNPAVGQNITVDVTYENIGSANLSDQMEMKLLIDEVAIDSIYPVSGLPADGNATIHFNVPWSSVITGTHVIKAIIDNDDQILEIDEANNVATRAVIVGSSANLHFKSLTVTNSYPNVGETIGIKSKIGNDGDLTTNANVSFYYVDNNLDSLLIQTQQITVAGNDSLVVNIPWVVADEKSRIVAIIRNSSVLEFNYGDNSAMVDIGKMALVFTSTPGCGAGNTGTLTANILGGIPPYNYVWNNGGAGQTLTAEAGNYSVNVFDISGQQVSGADQITTCKAIINLKAMIEGYYDGGALMKSTFLNQGKVQLPNQTDTVTVELYDPANGNSLVASYKNIINTDGQMAAYFPLALIGNSYYLAVRHRNSVAVWSAAPITLSANSSYDFTTAASQAYGDNQVEVSPGIFGMFSGDINQDDYVDASDYPLFDVDSQNNVQGEYSATDLNGDGFVDGSDYPLFDANSQNNVQVLRP